MVLLKSASESFNLIFFDFQVAFLASVLFFELCEFIFNLATACDFWLNQIHPVLVVFQMLVFPTKLKSSWFQFLVERENLFFETFFRFGEPVNLATEVSANFFVFRSVS